MVGVAESPAAYTGQPHGKRLLAKATNWRALVVLSWSLLQSLDAIRARGTFCPGLVRHNWSLDETSQDAHSM